MTQHSNHAIAKIFAWLILAFLLTSCASGPEKQRPEVLEGAYKNLHSGVTNYNKSKYVMAQSYFKTALKTFRSIDHREGIASSCLNIAKVHLERNELSLAKNYLFLAESLITESNIGPLKNHLVITQSSLAIANKEFETAKNILRPLIKIEQNSAIKLAALQNRIRIAFAEKDTDSAKSLTTAFAASLSSQRDTTYQARLHRFQAKLTNNQTESAIKYKQALNLYRKHAHKPGIASTLHEWGDQLIEHNDLQGAKDKLLRALFIRQSMEDTTGSIRLLISLNEIYKKQNAIKHSNETVRWINKLSAKRFNQWNRFIKAFNEYPTN